MSKIQLSFNAGEVSAVYFIIFDLVLLTIVDIVLGKLVCALYYRSINNGDPLTIQSADVPGVTTFLVGRYTSFPNLFAIFVKLAFLGCIVLIERGIESELIKINTQNTLIGTFRFNASDEIWDNSDNRVVTRRWERVRQCRKRDNDSITFYHIAFNLSDDQDISNEVTSDDNFSYLEVDDSSITCLSPDFVNEDSVDPILQVLGCSQMFPTDCNNEAVISLDTKLDFKISGEVAFVESGPGLFVLSVSTLTGSELFPMFEKLDDDDYENPELTCGSMLYGSNDENKRVLKACMLIVTYQGNTLIERWQVDENGTLSRQFPGPIFKGKIDYGLTQRYHHLVNIIIGFSWETFAATLLADSVIYERVVQDIVRYDERVMTTLPIYAVSLGIGLLALAIIARIVVTCTIGKDDRPQINSVDGLSSIAREEQEPSGRSLVVGRGVVVGLTNRSHGNRLHFGPLSAQQEGMKRTSDVEIM